MLLDNPDHLLDHWRWGANRTWWSVKNERVLRTVTERLSSDGVNVRSWRKQRKIEDHDSHSGNEDVSYFFTLLLLSLVLFRLHDSLAWNRCGVDSIWLTDNLKTVYPTGATHKRPNVIKEQLTTVCVVIYYGCNIYLYIYINRYGSRSEFTMWNKKIILMKNRCLLRHFVVFEYLVTVPPNPCHLAGFPPAGRWRHPSLSISLVLAQMGIPHRLYK